MKKLMTTLLLVGMIGLIGQSLPVQAETKGADSTGKHFVYDGKNGEKTKGTHKTLSGKEGEKTQGKHTTLTGNEPDDMSEPTHFTLMGKEQADQQRQRDFEQRVKDGKYDDLPDLQTGGGDIPPIPSGAA